MNKTYQDKIKTDLVDIINLKGLIIQIRLNINQLDRNRLIRL